MQSFNLKVLFFLCVVLFVCLLIWIFVGGGGDGCRDGWFLTEIDILFRIAIVIIII